MLRPEQPVPSLEVPLIGGGRWNVRDREDNALTLLSFYRGHFCRFCRAFLADLARQATELSRRRIDIVILSMDGAEQAGETKTLLAEPAISVGYGLNRTDAKRFGLFVSEIDRGGEVTCFVEPALFLLRPEGRIYAVIQNSISCGRPDLASLLDGIDVLAAAGFPPRGNA